TAAQAKQLLAMATSSDRLKLGERELFWLPSGGLMESELDLKALTKLAGPNTHRTMGTVEQIFTKYFAD
ncbi:MAG: hypothetical protein QOH13_358, partial [Thermoleophilaceae bacterium]|nr:hypothetical protein [Thermoleophilaceae bacterium]